MDPSRARRHHHNPVAEQHRLLDAMGHESYGHAVECRDSGKLLAKDRPRLRVHGSKGLVHQDDLRGVRQGPGDRDPLTHASGELMRIAIAEAL